MLRILTHGVFVGILLRSSLRRTPPPPVVVGGATAAVAAAWRSNKCRELSIVFVWDVRRRRRRIDST